MCKYVCVCVEIRGEGAEGGGGNSVFVVRYVCQGEEEKDRKEQKNESKKVHATHT